MPRWGQVPGLESETWEKGDEFVSALMELPVWVSLWVYGWVRVAAGPSGSCELELAFLLEPGCPQQYSGRSYQGRFCEPAGRMESPQGTSRSPGGSPPGPPGGRYGASEAPENVIQREVRRSCCTGAEGLLILHTASPAPEPSCPSSPRERSSDVGPLRSGPHLPI